MAKLHPQVHGTVRLTLTINGQDYTVIPQGLSQYKDCPQFTLKKSGSDIKYSIKVGSQGISCSCPDFSSRKREDDACKHIKAMNVFYMLR